MYDRIPGLILGFHGCDKSVRDAVVLGKDDLLWSQNTYDWLGHGVYFWENSYDRAMQFAQEQQKRGRIQIPSVLGAALSLDVCLDLANIKNLELLQSAYELLKKMYEQEGNGLPINRVGTDRVLRDLDCAVVEFCIKTIAEENNYSFDSVRSVFVEGNELYPGAGFKEKNHIQICVRNMSCIKGYFLPREEA